MNKTTKGSLAAGAAAVLLLGGAGSLAYWTAEADVDGGTISSGTLSLASDGPCDGWTYVSDGTTAADSAGEAAELFVPGDIITNTCTFTVGASGDNLEAEINVTEPMFEADETSLKLEPSAAYVIDTDGRTLEDGGLITSADNGAVITATLRVVIPFGTDANGNDLNGDVVGDGTPVNANNTQRITDRELDDIVVNLTQLDPNA